MNRPTLKSFKKEALKKKGVKDRYTDLAPAYEIRKKLIALRQEAGLQTTALEVVGELPLHVVGQFKGGSNPLTGYGHSCRTD